MGDLDADIFVLGKDWYPVNRFIQQKGVVNPNSTTNDNLIRLLQSIGVRVSPRYMQYLRLNLSGYGFPVFFRTLSDIKSLF
jgi:hypothetical protein